MLTTGQRRGCFPTAGKVIVSIRYTSRNCTLTHPDRDITYRHPYTGFTTWDLSSIHEGWPTHPHVHDQEVPAAHSLASQTRHSDWVDQSSILALRDYLQVVENSVETSYFPKQHSVDTAIDRSLGQGTHRDKGSAYPVSSEPDP